MFIALPGPVFEAARRVAGSTPGTVRGKTAAAPVGRKGSGLADQPQGGFRQLVEPVDQGVAVQVAGRDGERQAHVPGAIETGSGDRENAFGLQDADEGDVVGDGRLGNDAMTILDYLAIGLLMMLLAVARWFAQRKFELFPVGYDAQRRSPMPKF